MILYHGTNTKRLPSIKEKGLVPTAPKASAGDDYVYLTDKPKIAALFSGYGKDSQGFSKEGYMAPMDAKRQTGVVLKVKIDSKFLEEDQIWGKKINELKDAKKLYKKIYDEILNDLNKGNQVLEFEVETELHKLWKENAEEGDEYAPDFMDQEDWDYAIEKVVGKRAKSEVDDMLKEAKEYMSGKLYQYSETIPPENILGVMPAKKYLGQKKEAERQFGNGMEIQTL
jgi:hypothetical protein